MGACLAGQAAAKVGGKVGVGGVVLGGGSGYLDKMKDAITALPDMISYYPNLVKDFERLGKFVNGANDAGSGSYSALKKLFQLDLTGAYDSLKTGAGGAAQAYGVLKELDYNGLWKAAKNAVQNFGPENIVPTLAAAATVYVAGKALDKGLRFVRTRGQGTILDRAERAIGQEIWRKYFQKMKGKAGYAGRRNRTGGQDGSKLQ